MNATDRRRRRLVHFVSALKRGECPSARALAPKLAIGLVGPAVAASLPLAHAAALPSASASESGRSEREGQSP